MKTIVGIGLGPMVGGLGKRAIVTSSPHFLEYGTGNYSLYQCWEVQRDASVPGKPGTDNCVPSSSCAF